MSEPTGDGSHGGVEVAVAGDDQEIMTSAMLRKRVVTLCNAGDYQLALEVARLAQKGNVGQSASKEAAHVDVEDAGRSATGSSAAVGIAEGAPADANDIMLAEIIALLEEKVSFAAEDEEEDDSDTDGEEVEADEDEDEDEDSQTDEDESDDDDEATQ